MSMADDRLMTPKEVAGLFRVDVKTVARWAKQGRINRVRTLGGHGRYWESEVRALLEGQIPDEDPVPRPLRSGDRAGPAPRP